MKRLRASLKRLINYAAKNDGVIVWLVLEVPKARYIFFARSKSYSSNVLATVFIIGA